MDWVAVVVALIALLGTCVSAFLTYKSKKEDRKSEWDRCNYAGAFAEVNAKLDRRKEENKLLFDCMEVLLDHCSDGNHTGECKQKAEDIRQFKQERMWEE